MDAAEAGVVMVALLAGAGAVAAVDAGGPDEAGLALVDAGLLCGCSVTCTRPPAAAVPSISPVSVL